MEENFDFEEDDQMELAIAMSKAEIIQKDEEPQNESIVPPPPLSDLKQEVLIEQKVDPVPAPLPEQAPIPEKQPEPISDTPLQELLITVVRNNLMKKVLNSSKIDIFNKVLTLGSQENETIEELSYLFDLVHTFILNINQLANVEESWPAVKATVKNISNLIQTSLTFVKKTDTSNAQKKEQMNKLLERVIQIIKLMFDTQNIKDSSFDKSKFEESAAMISKSELIRRLSDKIDIKSNENLDFDIDASDEIIFIEESSHQRILRILKSTLSPQNDVIKEIIITIQWLLKEDLFPSTAFALFKTLSELTQQRKIQGLSLIKSFIEQVLEVAEKSPQESSFDFLVSLLKDAQISNQIGKQQKLKVFCRLIGGLGKLDAEKNKVAFDVIFNKVLNLSSVGADTLNLKDLGDTENENEYTYLSSLFEDSFLLMENMKKIQASQMGVQKSDEDRKEQDDEEEEPPLIDIPNEIEGIKQMLQIQKEITENIDSHSGEMIYQKVSNLLDSLQTAAAVVSTSSTSSSKPAPPNRKQAIAPVEEQTENPTDKYVKAITTIYQNLFTIYKQISENDILQQHMSKGLTFEILQKVVEQVNDFNQHHDLMSKELTRIVLLFINATVTFSQDFSKKFCSHLLNSVLRSQKEADLNNYKNLGGGGNFMASPSMKENGISESLNQLNEEILAFFFEGLFTVRNYHMVFLNLILINVQNKEQLFKELLGHITVMNPNILILVLILYTLLVPASSNIFENKLKSIIKNLLQSQNKLLNLGSALQLHQFLNISTKQNAQSTSKKPAEEQQVSSPLAIQLTPELTAELIALISKLNDNILLIQAKAANLQVFYSLMIELNQIAASLESTFTKSTLISNYEQILSFKEINSYENSIKVFNVQPVGQIHSIDPESIQLYALLLRTNHQLRGKSDKKGQAITVADTKPEEKLKGTFECLRKSVEVSKQISQLSSVYLKSIVSHLSESQTEREILLNILRKGKSRVTLETIESLENTESGKRDALYHNILKFVLLQSSSAISTSSGQLIDHLHKNVDAVFITELLSISSNPLKHLDKDLSEQCSPTTHLSLLDSLNKYLFISMFKVEISLFVDSLVSHVNSNIKGSLKDIFSQQKEDENVLEEVLLLEVANLQQINNVSGEQFLEITKKFAQYFNAIPSLASDHERMAFLQILVKFMRYSLDTDSFSSVVDQQNSKESGVIGLNLLQGTVKQVLAEVKISPINMKAFCFAVNFRKISIESPESVDKTLLKLCGRIRQQLLLKADDTSIHPENENPLLAILLNCPERQANNLLKDTSTVTSAINLRDRIWFPISSLIKTCFSHSDVDRSYKLENEQQQQQSQAKQQTQIDVSAAQLKSEKTKLSTMHKELEQKLNKALQGGKPKAGTGAAASEDQPAEKPKENLKKGDTANKATERTPLTYELKKDLFYNTESIAQFSLLRTGFTNNFLNDFNQLLLSKREVLLSFISDCEISLAQLASVSSEKRNEVMTICFTELMSLFEAIVKEARESGSDRSEFVQGVLILSSEIISQIANKVYESSSTQNDSSVITYNTERILAIAHFIFTNSSVTSIDQLESVIKDVLRYAVWLSRTPAFRQHYIEVLLLIILHIKSAEKMIAENKLNAEKAKDDSNVDSGAGKEGQKKALPSVQQKSERSREDIIEDILKKFNTLPSKLSDTMCTIDKYSGKMEVQSFYKCHTCNLSQSNIVICKWCAYTCHNGHDLVYYSDTRGTCDCADQGPPGICKSKSIKNDPKGPKLPQTSNRQALNQFSQEFLQASMKSADIPPNLVQFYMKTLQRDEAEEQNEEMEECYEEEEEDREEEEKNQLDDDEEAEILLTSEVAQDLPIQPAPKAAKALVEPVMSEQVDSKSIETKSEAETLILRLMKEHESATETTGIYNAFDSIFSLCEEQAKNLVSHWGTSLKDTKKEKSEKSEFIDFSSTMVVSAGQQLQSLMDNSLGKIVCRLNKSGTLEMQIKEDGFQDQGYYRSNVQPVAPMIIRKPIDHNLENMIVVASGQKVIIIDKSKLFSRVAEGVNLNQLPSTGAADDLLFAQKLLQLSASDLSVTQALPAGYSVVHLRFSPKNPSILAVAGLHNLNVWRISPELKISKNAQIPNKSANEYINKVLWLPNSESIRLNLVNFEGQSQSMMKVSANDQSGMFKDFTVIENPIKANEFIVLVACADGRLYYHEFGTQQRDEIILTNYISIPQEFVPKGQVCMGVSFSAQSHIISLSFKNGVNIFGKLDFKNHKLVNCFTYRPLQSQNKNGLLQFFERSGEIIVNASQFHLDQSASTYVVTLRDPNNQQNYSIHSGFLTLIKMTSDSIIAQPLATNLVKPTDERKCEGFCYLTCEKYDGVKFVMSLHEDGALNLFGVPIENSITSNSIQLGLRDALLGDPKDKKKKSGEEDSSKTSATILQRAGGPNDNQASNSSPSSAITSDPTFEILKQEFKLTDLTYIQNTAPILHVDFAQTYPLLPVQASLRVDVNNVLSNSLLLGDQSTVLISKSDPQEISIRSQLNKGYIITGVRVRMQMGTNTKQGIYKIKVFNRELKILNSSSSEQKNVDLSFSTQEMIYAYLQGKLSFVITSTSPVIPVHEIKIIMLQVYGTTIEEFKLKEKLETLKTCFGIRALSSAGAQDEKDESLAKKEKDDFEIQILDSSEILPLDFLKRRMSLSKNIESVEIRQFVDSLDALTVQLAMQQSSVEGSALVEEQSTRLKGFAEQLRVLLIDPVIDNEANQYLLSSVKRTLKQVLALYAQLQINVKIVKTHPMEYKTFKMLSRTKMLLNALKSGECPIPLIHLFLKRATKPTRLPLVFMVFGLQPMLIENILVQFLKDLNGDYDVKICQQTIRSLIEVIMLYFQFLKNREAAELQDAELKDIFNNEKVKVAGGAAFKLLEKLFEGLQKSNLRSSMGRSTKELIDILKSESTSFLELAKESAASSQKSTNISVSFDMFSYRPIVKGSELKKEPAIPVALPTTNLAVQVDHENDIVFEENDPQYDNFQNDPEEDIQDEFDQYDDEDPEGDQQAAYGGIYAGFDNMNEEEMMKLAIEMSLQEKGPAVPEPVQPANIPVQAEEKKENDEAEKEEIETKAQVAVQIEKEVEQEIASDNSVQKDELDFDIVEKSIRIIQFDPTKDIAISILDTFSNGGKKEEDALSAAIENEMIAVYLYVIVQVLRMETTQTEEIALQLASTFYKLLCQISSSNLVPNNANEEAKYILLAVKILNEIIKPIKDHLSNRKGKKPRKLSANESQNVAQQFGQPQVQSKQSKTSKSLNIADPYKQLKEHFRVQLKQYEEKNGVSFQEKLHSSLSVMQKHFEGGRSSLKIEYANGEIISVASKVTLPATSSEIISEGFKKLEEFSSKITQLMAVVDQLVFGNTINLLFSLVVLDKSIISGSTVQKWSVTLSEMLVSPVTSYLQQRQTERLLETITDSSASYYEMRDGIALHKQFDVICRVHGATTAFKNPTYEHLLVIGQSITKTLKIAKDRRKNWHKFCSSKSNFIPLLYDIVLNQVRGCVESTLQLISLFYGPIIAY